MGLCSLFGARRRTEEPQYSVVETLDEATEVRRYALRIAAEVRLPGGDDPMTRGRAFRVLFDYITGNNVAESKVAMTAPVESRGGENRGGRGGARIAMTVPVESARRQGKGGDGGCYAMRFFLPASYTSETAPKPRDDRVSLVEIPEALVAVRQFSGLRGGLMVDRQAAKLRRTLKGSAWQAEDSPAGRRPVAWFYDPPSTLPFRRRNEVAVAVVRASGEAEAGGA